MLKQFQAIFTTIKSTAISGCLSNQALNGLTLKDSNLGGYCAINTFVNIKRFRLSDNGIFPFSAHQLLWQREQ